MAHYDNKTIATRQEPDPVWLGDVEALSSEICAELREIVEMLATYRQTIHRAARLNARTDVSLLIGPRPPN
ncbi:MAG: hypothetical protein ACRDZO_12895 [Egibacteraceae bacterium]